ncbi:beta-1,4-galactosyltransferase 2-like isoform X2 [Physella acuta]|uniref:beta-1,4-galactosyltransferase 2-like isoform X2 n=1 Tax=Physella acuta TaxID=109671 RepID=UPI0027DC6928|nr:beta-1,4-galactosyltransferase 2-like isoform X2 [Physella acuta]
MLQLTKSRPARYLMSTVIAFVIINLLIVLTTRFRHQDISTQTYEVFRRYDPYGQFKNGKKVVDMVVQDSRRPTEPKFPIDIVQGKQLLDIPNTGVYKTPNTEDLGDKTPITEDTVDETPNTDPPRPACQDSSHTGTESPEIENKPEGLTQLKLCPFDLENLIGHLAPMTQNIEPSQLEKYFPDLEDGGRLRPRDCVPRQRLALIIPYRNRWLHLHVMLHNLLPILKRQQADVTIFVIEQTMPGRFNRGALSNIGFLEAEKLGKFDCYIFHDVDLIPLNDYHLYRCDSQPRHFAVYMNKYNYRISYPAYFGGVTGFSRGQYLQINGYSNLYFGWGGEDDDLYNRTLSQGFKVSRSPANVARYLMFNHSRDVGNEDNPDRMFADGLNTCKYQVRQITRYRLFTLITVALNEAELLKQASAYLLNVKSNNQTSHPGQQTRIKPKTSTNISQPLPLE